MPRTKTTHKAVTLETPFSPPERTFPGIDEIDPLTFPAFLDEIGLVHMGGNGENISPRFSSNNHVYTLAIDGTEPSPATTISQAILLHDSLWVAAGAVACAKACGAERIVLAVRKGETSVAELEKRYHEFSIVAVPAKHSVDLGKQIQGSSADSLLILDAATVRAVGRAIVDGIPVVERPLALAMPSEDLYKNIVAPVDLSIRDVLETCKLPFDPDQHHIVAAGRPASPDALIEKTTDSLVVLNNTLGWRIKNRKRVE